MTTVFPAAPLGVEADLYLGAWTDVSSYVLQRDGSTPISITRGRPDESSQMNPSQSSLQMKNPDGRFTIMNPMGPYYGLLTRNCPMRLSLPNTVLPAVYATTYLRMEDDAVSYASCPAAAGIELAGSMDVRIDIDLSGYGFLPLAGIWSASSSVNQRCWMFGLNSDGTLFLSWTTDGTMATLQSAPSDYRNPLPLGRQCIRVTLNAATGDVKFYTAPAGGIDSGPFTQLGPTSTGPGTTVFASTSAPLTIGYSAGYSYDYNPQIINADLDLIAPQGAVYDMELRNGVAGSVVAHPSFNTQAAGATSWTDANGNTWTLTGTAELSNRAYRYHGEMTALPKASDPSAKDVYVSAVASGVMHRLQQAQSPINSPFYRNYVRITGTGAPVAYWPCEDGAGATQIASALSGGTAMTLSGPAQLANSNSFVCSDALPVINGSTWTGPVSAPSANWSNGWMAAMLVDLPSGGDTNLGVIARIANASAAAPRIDVVYSTTNGGEIAIGAYNAAGSLITSGILATIFLNGGSTSQNLNGLSLYLAVSLIPSGSNLTLVCYAMIPGGAGMDSVSTSLGAGTVGAVTSVTVNPFGAASSGGLASIGVGHIAVHAAGAFTWDVGDPLNAWLGEPAAARYQRLCYEEGINCRIYGHKLTSAAMGYQTIQTLPDLLQECETTDRGMQFEPRTVLGLGYRPASALYNQTPKVTTSYAASSLDPTLAPTSDDQLSINDVTASNTDGSSARQILTTGPMSIQAPPNGISRIDTGQQVNAASDGQLASIAGWILHTSSDPYDRIPVIPFNMARAEVPAAVALLDIGDYTQITSPPPWIQYDTIDQLGAGYSETFGPAGVWTIDVNGIPARPYVIAQVAGMGGNAVHVDTDGSTLTNNQTSTDSVLSLTSMAGYPTWTTNPSDMPFDVNIAGERVTVVSPGTLMTSNPLFLTGIAGWSAQAGTVAWSQDFLYSASATGAIKGTPNGTSVSGGLLTGMTAVGTVTPTANYVAYGWVYSPQGWTDIRMVFDWYDASGTFLSTGLGSASTVPAGAWTFLSQTLTAPASASRAIVRLRWGSTPPATVLFYGYSMGGYPASSVSATSPQQVSAIRSVNGVAKSQTAGTAVSLWYPATVGL